MKNMFNNKWTLGVIGLIVGIVVSIFVHSPSVTVGALGVKLAENYDSYIKYNGGYYSNLPISTTGTLSTTGVLSSTGGLKVGSSGTTLNNVSAGFCYIKAYATTIVASSTAQVDCQATALVDQSTNRIGSALSGVLYGDSVTATLASTTAGSVFGGIDVIGASASTTNGYITLIISNQTGATYTWPTSGAATGTASYVSVR